MDGNVVPGIENVVGKNVTSTTQQAATKTIGKDDFMKLLLAQLKNQDPLKPLDGTDFAAQLAQFSSLEQLNNMNAELKTQSLNQMVLGYAQSASMIGKEVVTSAGNMVTADGSTASLNYNLAKDAQNVTITIFDKTQKRVNSWEETGQKAGMNKVTWDCSDIERGDYTFQVTAKDGSGNPVSAETMTTGIVTAVHFRNNQILATVHGQEILLSNLISVREAEKI